MSAAQKIAQLEALLERIQSNRTDAPEGFTAAPAESSTPDREPSVEATLLDFPGDAEETSAPSPAPAVPSSAVIAAPSRPAQAPTPMERAVSTELELGPEDDGSDATPTAPVHTRSPDTERPASYEPPAHEPSAEETAAPEPRPEEAPPRPERIELAVSPAAAPIAKVVARPKPRTFGELLDRALALRPR